MPKNIPHSVSSVPQVPPKDCIQITVQRCTVCQRNLTFQIDNQPLRTVIVFNADRCTICDKVICIACANLYHPVQRGVESRGVFPVCDVCKPSAKGFGLAPFREQKKQIPGQ